MEVIIEVTQVRSWGFLDSLVIKLQENSSRNKQNLNYVIFTQV